MAAKKAAPPKLANHVLTHLWDPENRKTTSKELEIAISKAYHGNAPVYTIRYLQAIRAVVQERYDDAIEYFADASYMFQFGDRGWREEALLISPAENERTAKMLAEMAHREMDVAIQEQMKIVNDALEEKNEPRI